tara:strand:+ start:956 stop:1654 length:699 start_codon:yes stop_codon:yes gene_type:complete
MSKLSIKNSYSVESIPKHETYEWLLYKHYLKRKTSISYSFGLFNNDILVGVCTFGNAVPLQMKKSICGEKYMHLVYELNRLCTNDNLDKNANSFFLGQIFKLLPKPIIIVSYADQSIGHNGYIYQSTNFIYTGESHTQMDWKLRGREHIHSRTLMDEFAFEKDRINKLKEKYGDALYQVRREPKYRYIKLLGSKKQIKLFKKHANFRCLPYPKGSNSRYKANFKPKTQVKLF